MISRRKARSATAAAATRADFCDVGELREERLQFSRGHAAEDARAAQRVQVRAGAHRAVARE
jgi:hypothetical protein